MRKTAALLATLLLAACRQGAAPQAPESFYGTLEPFASEAVYFVVTDRFVNGDPDNDQRDQGGAFPTFDRPIPGPDGESANIGYLGGDFKGIVDNAGYIRDMGFTAVWITPVVDNPDAAFSGGRPASWGSAWTDQGKTGYHGYWGVNFYRLDEHLPSPGLDFAGFTAALRAHGLKTVLDAVVNHGSPAFSMPEPQPEFGKLYGRDGELLADHQNLHPSRLDPVNNPLHRFFRTEPDVAELADFDHDNPQVREYLIDAHLFWIAQGVDALRLDTLKHVPHAFWKEFAERVRAEHPGLFMFGEAWDYDADAIASYTWPENGGISVLDFPLKGALAEIFEQPDSDYARVAEALHLEHGPYHNPYELATFYDNHDTPRMNASDEGFIDAHNWLFTARGIPVVYYGSEVGFMRGRGEHAGNRNYFGQARIDAAVGHPIREHLKRIATLRAQSPALQKGLQLNVELAGHRAAFYRVFQHEGVHQIALVLLNKGDEAAEFAVRDYLQAGEWRAAFGGETVNVSAGEALTATVPAHGVEVFFLDAPVSEPTLRARLAELMANRLRRTSGG
ncbi:cyclomaltodextrin glucanotransferase [Rehaibacterium terrae]|jgi:glycosidase|uniref:Alpha-amylase n=1 Tax=Rehaibacterium terrae TaxID=1341696 RepID=A0A7W7V7L6_9GAMM|nr:cyclomaltodextrin glucanotransferase [Rehaibacterium terrae]